MSEAPESRTIRLCLARMLAHIEAAEGELGRLDAVAGDGDHGAGMVRGLRAAVAVLPEPQESSLSPGDLLVQAGSAFADEAGGASGALVGTLLVTVGQTLADGPITTSTMCAALNAGVILVRQLGKSDPGDKTMVDTLHPFVEALHQAADRGLSLREAWIAALPAAQAGANSTAAMVSRRGRAARLGERSRGHLDPGAVSTLYMVQAVGTLLAEMEPCAE